MKPTVSIAIPVFNGANYLEQAIESVLAQEFQDYELLISDNASTDQTREICERYAAQDQRIRYYRHETNRGATWNFNHIFEFAQGKYFAWLAHDDMYSPQFIKQCVSILDEHSDVVLCFSNVVIVDEQSKPIEDFPIQMRTDSDKVGERFYDLLMVWHDCLPIFGVIRADDLRKTPLIGPYSSGDHVLLARIGLLGKYYIVPQDLFISRRHPLQSNKMYNVWVDHHAYSQWFRASKKGKWYLPQWELMRDYLMMVKEADMSLKEKILCYLAVGRWSVRYRRILYKDLVLAVQNLNRSEKVSAEERSTRSL